MLTGLKIDISYSYIAENVLTYIFMYQFCLSLCELLYLLSQVCNLFSTYLVWQLGQVIRYQGNHYYWPSKIQMQAQTLMPLRRLRCHLQQGIHLIATIDIIGREKKNFFNPLLVEKLAERSLFFQRIEIFFLPVFEILTLYNKTCMC